MPRGFKADERATKLLFNNGIFKDRRSKIVYSAEMVPHLLLKGMDMSDQRERVWKRDRGHCQIKGLNCSGNAHELDHIKGGSSGRCDCQHNLQAVCFTDHRGKHVQVQWTKRKTEAHQDFAEIYKERT